MKKGKNELLRFAIGLVLLAVGLYAFMANVTVTTGFYSWHIGTFRAGGLVVVPLIAGVVWLFIDGDSILAKILTVIGILLIVASVVMGTTFVFLRTNLYEYLIMLILMFGGFGLILSVLLAKPKDKSAQTKDMTASKEDYDRLEKELVELKSKMK